MNKIILLMFFVTINNIFSSEGDNHGSKKLYAADDINYRDENDNTLLHALMKQEIFTLKDMENILCAGVSPNARNKQGNTALHLLMQHPNAMIEHIDILLKYKVDLMICNWFIDEQGKTIANKIGLTAYQYAHQYRGQTPFEDCEEYAVNREVKEYLFAIMLDKALYKVINSHININ